MNSFPIFVSFCLRVTTSDENNWYCLLVKWRGIKMWTVRNCLDEIFVRLQNFIKLHFSGNVDLLLVGSLDGSKIPTMAEITMGDDFRKRHRQTIGCRFGKQSAVPPLQVVVFYPQQREFHPATLIVGESQALNSRSHPLHKLLIKVFRTRIASKNRIPLAPQTKLTKHGECRVVNTVQQEAFYPPSSEFLPYCTSTCTTTIRLGS